MGETARKQPNRFLKSKLTWADFQRYIIEFVNRSVVLLLEIYIHLI